MKTNETFANYQPKYFTHYFRLEKTKREKWFELDCQNSTEKLSFFSKYIKQITWVELMHPVLSVFQMDEISNNKIVLRISYSEGEEKYWIGKFRYSEEACILLIEHKKTGVELYFCETVKTDTIGLLHLFHSGLLKKDINFYRWQYQKK